MKKVMILMTVFMGLIMSIVLSFVGNLMSPKFTFMGYITSLGVSFAISLIIGFLVPIKKLGDSACNKCNINPHSFKGTLVSAAISDLIYTPVITIVMVYFGLTMARKNAPAAEAANIPSYWQALPLSLIVCLLAGFVVIVIVQPVLIKLLTKNMKREG